MGGTIATQFRMIFGALGWNGSRPGFTRGRVRGMRGSANSFFKMLRGAFGIR